ncbi:hypothetical protein LIER_00633 [Lithospermum erythrorhizon]|uniref:ZF-HD dimerization-type domain-containing protein n=1 Tax=Lithospermum erythrorhizon TaxID=34254 RepID=A0AAV3NI74_LITER
MELPSQEGEMPIPISSAYVQGGHMIHQDPSSQNDGHILPSNGPILPSSPLPHQNDLNVPFKKVFVRYRECLKNHAASMGGNATDGCGEFMPSGEEGSLEALICSACNCHRNFHRKEIAGDQSYEFFHKTPHHLKSFGRKLILGHHKNQGILGNESFGYHTGSLLLPSRPAQPPHQMIMPSYNFTSLPSDSDDDGGNLVVSRPQQQHQLMKKRFRTKFTPEQKEKMLQFAEKAGWKMQKQEESMVQQFCQEIGVKRRVLKVWMHNNKHILAKKNNNSSTNNSQDYAAKAPEVEFEHTPGAI